MSTFKMDEINEKIKDIWNSNKIFSNYAPMIYPDLKKNSLLFIGLNPSIDENINLVRNSLRYLHSKSTYSKIPYDVLHKYKNVDKYTTKLAGLQKYFKEKYRYFNFFREVIADLDSKFKNSLEWEERDLFFIRKTSSRVVKGIYFPEYNLIDLAKKELYLSRNY